MKTLYCLTQKIMNGNVVLQQEMSLYTDSGLAGKVMERLKGLNVDSPYPIVYDISECSLFESESEIPALNPKGTGMSPKTVLKCSLGVSNYCDGNIDGKMDITSEEQSDGVRPRVPCTERSIDVGTYSWRWCPVINVDEGRISNWEPGVSADIRYKVCDDCEIECLVGGKTVCTNDGYFYCPEFLCPQGEGYGDYVIMRINGEGYISRWNRHDVEKWMKTQLEGIKEEQE